MSKKAEKWLFNEDNVCREDRLSRLKWIMKEYPEIDFAIYEGGIKTKYLFDEARYCFVYGQFLASTFLCLAYIENSLASHFFGAGRNDIIRISSQQLLEEAFKVDLIDQNEFILLNHIRELRNSLIHFQNPNNYKNIEIRGVFENKHPYQILEEDAIIAMSALFKIFKKFSI